MIHALKEWVSHKKEGRANPIAKSYPAYLLSAVTHRVLIYLDHDIKTMYVITPFSALVLGYLGNSVFFRFIKAKEKDVEVEPPVKITIEKTETLDDGSKPGEEGRPDKP